MGERDPRRKEGKSTYVSCDIFSSQITYFHHKRGKEMTGRKVGFTVKTLLVSRLSFFILNAPTIDNSHRPPRPPLKLTLQEAWIPLFAHSFLSNATF